MKIALLGYGKMGKEVEKIALSRGHEIILRLDSEDDWDTQREKLAEADVAIEFSVPESALTNIFHCFDFNLPVVVGTTGWLGQLEHVKQVCEEHNQALFYASNFSVGVNLFFELNRRLAQLMNNYDEYDARIEETHHIHKLDKPSGTALTLADSIISLLDRKDKWVNDVPEHDYELGVISHREEDVPGTHVVSYTSDIDDIEIRHIAKSRRGFALGAMMAAEWLPRRRGIFTMADLLKF